MGLKACGVLVLFSVLATAGCLRVDHAQAVLRNGSLPLALDRRDKLSGGACVREGGGGCLPIEALQHDEWRNKVRNGGVFGFPGEERLMYKASVAAVEDQPDARRVYIDMGSREYESSIGDWFRSRYPEAEKFHVVAFEPECAYDETYREHPEVELHHYAVWSANTTLPWSRAHAELFFASGSDGARPAIDIADFLRRRVKKSDYVVVKMDIEGAEYEVVPHLIKQGVEGLIDEMFIEAHTDINSMFKGNKAAGHHRADALKLIQSLRDAGVYAHEWA